MPTIVRTLAVAAALATAASTGAMAQYYSCPAGYTYWDGACRMAATPGGVVGGAVGTATGIAGGAVGAAGTIAGAGLNAAGNVVGGTLGAVTGTPYYGSSYPPGYYSRDYYYYGR